jgi:hypothetical protein
MRRWVWVWLVLGLCAGVSRAQIGEVLDSGFRVNMRSEPNRSAPIVAVLEPRTQVLVIARSPGDTWYQIGLLDGRVGWVAAEYINIATLDAPFAFDAAVQVPFEVASMVANINENTVAIFRRGQLLGNRPDVFSKVGDSITASSQTLAAIGEGLYDLGDYWYLQPVIEFYSRTPARLGNSFSNRSLAARVGWNTETVLDPSYADANLCQPGESPLACEYRWVQPAVALIMLGTNDAGFMNVDVFRRNLSRIVETSILSGVIPVLSTIPPRLDRPEVNRRIGDFNVAIVDTAYIYNVPLMDYYSAMSRLPGFGLTADGVHPTVAGRGYVDSAVFNARTLQYGYNVRNLLLLTTLDALWRAVIARG